MSVGMMIERLESKGDKQQLLEHSEVTRSNCRWSDLALVHRVKWHLDAFHL